MMKEPCIQHQTSESSHTLSFVCVLVVWGDYTRLFLELALPSQLAPDNLQSLNKQTIYQIYTTQEDASIIRQHGAFKQLANLCLVEFYITQVEGNKYRVMSDCHKQAIDKANAHGYGLIFLTPDSILSNGSLKAVKNLAYAGKKVVSTVGLRLKKETVTKLLMGYKSLTQFEMAISARILMKIALNNLHSITVKHLWKGADQMIPNNLFWVVADEGLVGRCFHLHPLMVNPCQKTRKFLSTIDYDYPLSACPDLKDHYVITDSDEVCICELTTETREMTGVPNGSMKELILFAERQANPNHLHNAGQIIKMHTGTQTFEKWEEAIADSNAVFKQLQDALKDNSFILFFTNSRRFLFRILRQNEELSIATNMSAIKKFQRRMLAKVAQLFHNRLSVYLKACFVSGIHYTYRVCRQALSNER